MTKLQQTKRRAQKKLDIIESMNAVARGGTTNIYTELQALAEALLFLLEGK